MTMITINVKEKRVVVVNAGIHWTKQWIHSDLLNILLNKGDVGQGTWTREAKVTECMVLISTCALCIG